MIDLKDTLLYKGVYNRLMNEMVIRNKKKTIQAIKDPSYSKWLRGMGKGRFSIDVMIDITNRPYMQDEEAVSLVRRSFKSKIDALLYCDVQKSADNEYIIYRPKTEHDMLYLFNSSVKTELGAFCTMVLFDVYLDLPSIGV